MKSLLSLVLICVSTSLYAAPVPPRDEPGIRSVLGAFETAWNLHDPVSMAALWADDGDLISPKGKWGTNRVGVEKVLTEEQQGPFKVSTFHSTVDRIRFLTPELAQVDASVKITLPTKDKAAPRNILEQHLVLIMSYKNNKWRILSARPYALEGSLLKIR